MNKLGLIIVVSILGLLLTACPPTKTQVPTEISFEAVLNGASEVPPNVAKDGKGTASAILKNNVLTVTGTYSGLSGAPTGAHIHGPASTSANAGVVFALTTTAGAAPSAGTLSGSATLTAAQVAELKAGMYYINVHTSKYAAGQIRGQLTEK